MDSYAFGRKRYRIGSSYEETKSIVVVGNVIGGMLKKGINKVTIKTVKKII